MEVVSFEIAKKLKEKGFKKECLCHYIGDDLVYNIESPITNNQLWFCHNKYDNIWHRDNIDAPTIPQVLEWLREKNIHLYTDIDNEGWFFEIKCLKTRFMVNTDFFERYSTYELAALAGIEYVIDNLI
ncbi:MAG: hypothetical protein J6A59_03360 [Lachnospiraceae bacterium]|nr:hypothetical protein [Lachnospiraceae bacterium]